MKNFRRLAALTAPILSWSISAHALLIDDFASPSSQEVTLSPNPPASDNDQSLATVLGGERDLRVERNQGNGSMGLDVNDTITGALSFAEAFSTYGIGTVVWDGVDGSSAINATGLGGIDLLANGGSAFALGLIGSDQSSRVEIQVFSDAANHSTLQHLLPASGSTLLTFLFSDFVTSAGSGVDFANVGAIQLKIDGTLHEALDLAVDFFGTNANTPVPEPSSLTLLGLGLAGAGRSYRRRRAAAA